MEHSPSKNNSLFFLFLMFDFIQTTILLILNYLSSKIKFILEFPNDISPSFIFYFYFIFSHLHLLPLFQCFLYEGEQTMSLCCKQMTWISSRQCKRQRRFTSSDSIGPGSLAFETLTKKNGLNCRIKAWRCMQKCGWV